MERAVALCSISGGEEVRQLLTPIAWNISEKPSLIQI